MQRSTKKANFFPEDQLFYGKRCSVSISPFNQCWLLALAVVIEVAILTSRLGCIYIQSLLSDMSVTVSHASIGLYTQVGLYIQMVQGANSIIWDANDILNLYTVFIHSYTHRTKVWICPTSLTKIWQAIASYCLQKQRSAFHCFAVFLVCIFFFFCQYQCSRLSGDLVCVE